MDKNASDGKPLPSKSVNSLTTIPRRDWLEWLALVAIFLIAGTMGHDPWGKKSEAYLFGIIYDFYTTHSWLIPRDAGIPFMEKPPLYAWTSAIFCNLLGSLLPLHDAARLTSVLYMGITTVFLWKTARILFRKHAEGESLTWICTALFLGTYGVAHWAHELITDVPLLAGTTVALYGMTLLCMTPEHWKRAGFWLGVGMGAAFMSKGLFMPVVLGISGTVAWLILPELHRRTMLRGVLLAVIVAIPLFVVWPALIYHASPSLFMEWFWDNNVGRFLGFSVQKLGAENDRSHLLSQLPMFVFPIFPLACIEIVCARKEWRRPEYFLPLIIALIGVSFLFVSASGRMPYTLPLLPCFALLGAPALMRFVPRFFICWNTLARVAFTLITAGFWLIWWNLLHPSTHRPLPWLARQFSDIYSPDLVLHAPQTLACLVAITAALFWLWSFRLRGNSALDTARIWFAGMALAWCTAYTLLLPWINETHSYRTAVTEMLDFAAHSPYAGDCIADYRLGENMAPMVEYFMGLKKPLPFADREDTSCHLAVTFMMIRSPNTIDSRWHMIWRGTRLRDVKTYELRLYARK